MRPVPEDDDPVVRFLAQRGTSSAGVCPESEVLGGFAEGRLAKAERDAIDRHLVNCADCSSVVAALVGEAVPATAPRSSGSRWLRPVVAAAGVLVVASIAFFALRARPTDLGARLMAAADDLRAKSPAAFADFRPLSPADLAGLGREEVRAINAIRIVYPAKKILETRPTFRFEAAPRSEPYEIVLTTAKGGEELWRAKGVPGGAGIAFPSTLPELRAGTAYLWEVGDEVRRFEVATDAEREAFAAREREIDVRVEAPLRSLLKAHLALRSDLIGEAERHARAARREHPTDPVAKATLLATLRVLGADSSGI